MSTPMRPKETYRESYRRGGFLKQELLPERFPFTPEGFRVDAIEMMAAGALEDGREFQEIRVFVREVPVPEPKPLGSIGILELSREEAEP